MINIEEFTFLSSDGQTRLHAMLWLPEGEIRGILQIAHGVAEHVARYDGFARYLCARGIAVAGHDHLGTRRTSRGRPDTGPVHHNDPYVQRRPDRPRNRSLCLPRKDRGADPSHGRGDTA